MRRLFCVVVSQKNALTASSVNNDAAQITRTGLVEKTGNNIADAFASESDFLLELLCSPALLNAFVSLEIVCLIFE